MWKLVLLITVLVSSGAFAQSKPKKVKIKIPVRTVSPFPEPEQSRVEWREVWVDARLAEVIKAQVRSRSKPPKNSVPFKFNGQTYYYQLARKGKAQGK